MILYHTTIADVVASIRADGFRGSSGSFMFTGIWFDDVVFLGTFPADVNEGAKGDVVLGVEVDLDMSEYLIEEEGLPPWEYVVPAAVLNNAIVSITVMTEEDLHKLAVERWVGQTTTGES